MKRCYLKTIVILALISGCFTACIEDEEPSLESFNCIITTDTTHAALIFNTHTQYQTSININWGDGKKDNLVIETFNSAGISHTYENAGKLTHTITVKGGKEVNILRCDNNKFTSLSVSGNLTDLNCDKNLLTTLDLSRLKLIRFLSLESNQLSSLDLSKNPEITNLKVSNNQLSSLDLSNKTRLYILDASNNQLTSLNISNTPTLESLTIENNMMDAQSLNELFNALTDQSGSTQLNTIVLTGNPGAATCDKSIATKKGWRIF